MKLHLPIIALSLTSVLAVDNKKASFMKVVDNSKPDYMQDLLTDTDKAGHNIRGTQGNRRLQEICLPEYTYTSQAGCTTSGLLDFVANLTEALSAAPGCNHGIVKELSLVLGVEIEGKTPKEVREKVFGFFWLQCFDFWSTQEGTDFAKIGDGTDVFTKAFFDGGTYWNEARETTNIDDVVVNKLSVDPGEKIVEIQNTTAVTGLIDLPEQITNFDSCKANAAMCCWVADRQADDDGNCAEPYDTNCINADPNDNTDVCAVNLFLSNDSNGVRGGVTLFPDMREGRTHCHGFAWSDDAIDTSTIFKGNNLFHISLFDHLYKRGYVKNVPGAPMCGCVEQMPIVTRADCTEMELVQSTTFTFAAPTVTVAPSEEWEVNFKKCNQGNAGIRNNDFEAYLVRMVDEKRATKQDLNIIRRNVVGDDNCPAVIESAIERLVAGQA